LTGPEQAYGHLAIWRIAGPMILSAISTPLLGLVDTAVIGRLDQAWYLGAVAVGATIFSALFMSLNFLRMGTTGLTAQAFGAQSNRGLREALGQAAVTAIALAALLLLVQAPLLDIALALIAPSDEVREQAGFYYQLRIWSAPASLLNFVIIGWLLGLQNARAPLMIILCINFTNILLDLWFVIGLGWQVRGVAAATLAAEYAGLLLGTALVRQELRRRSGDWRDIDLTRLRDYARLFNVNGFLFLRTLTLMLVFAFITAQGARLGDSILAANAVLMNFQYLMSYALDGIAHAAEALVGRAAGARDRAGLLLAVRRCLEWSVGFAACFSVAYWLGGEELIAVLTTVEAVRNAAGEYLPWLILSPLVSVWSFLYDGVYVGITRSREMMWVMVGSAALLFFPAWLISHDLGNHGLWLAFILFMAGRGIGMHTWFRALIAGGRLPLAQENPSS
jgi:MATE family multidrug resistance protein